MSYYLTPMTVDEISELVGPTFATSFQVEMDLIFQPLRKHLEKGRPLSLGKEIWEYAVADSINNAEWCGAGHNIIDVKVNADIGIDVKSVSRDDNAIKTTESSMFQTFKDETKKHFNENNTESLWNLFVDGWFKKTKSIKKYYLMAIIRDKKTLDCFLCCFRVNDVQINYSPNLCKLNTKTMKVDGIVNGDYADVLVYSSKTRLEIKFKRKLWESKTYSMQIYENPWIERRNLINFFI
jgi:hypothetical protein